MTPSPSPPAPLPRVQGRGEQAPIPAHLTNLFPNGSPALLALFQSAEENASFLRSDFFTLRDWLEIAAYQEESLHALLLLLILAQEEGSLCIEISTESLTRRLLDLVEPDQARDWADRLVADLTGHDFGNLIGTTADDQRPIIRHVADGRRYLYFQKFLRSELEFAQTFRAKLLCPPAAGQSANLDALMRAVLDDQPLRPGGQTLQLDSDQRRAVEFALSRPLVLISGGPGTGKTSIVLTLLRCLVRSGMTPDRIALAAPTGRAAQRLADAIRLGLASLPHDPDSPDAQLKGLDATTLHQLLDYVPSSDQFRRHAENPIEAEVVIVDEVSMVGMVLMARLFQALHPQARLILLGDKDQLPSVDAGAVLANLIPNDWRAVSFSGRSPSALREALVILQTNYRSEPHIRAIAAAVNRQEFEALDDLPILDMNSVGRIANPAHGIEVLDDLPKDPATQWSHLATAKGVRFLEQKAETPGEIRRMIQLWADHAFLTNGFKEVLAECTAFPEGDDSPRRLERLVEIFRLLDQTRLLTLVRDGPWGCVAINRVLDQYLRPRLDRPNCDFLFPGASVLITRNDHARRLFNGDVGITLGSPDGSLRVVFPRQGSFLTFPADALPAHELGFALTVHKSQGSEYGQVFLVFPPTGGRRLLTKELVYTAITRAKDLVILCATRAVLHQAIQKKCTRESGMLRFD